MSDPIIKVDWTRLAPFISSFAVVLMGEFVGFALVALGDGVSLFAGWAEVGMALLGGLVLEIILEWSSEPPKKANMRRRRMSRFIAGVAYGLGAINIIDIIQKLAEVVV